jgi:hypothetical protein
MEMITGDWKTRYVHINGEYLDPKASQAVYNHSPDGFNWGYGGSGPAQLALAILLKFESNTAALSHYQLFKWDIIAKLPEADFELPMDTVRQWIMEHK